MRKAILCAFAIALPAGMSAGAAPAPLERTSIGVDIAAPLAGAFMGAVAASLSLELPLSGSWAVDLESSVYSATGTGTWIFQTCAGALARFYPLSLFLTDAARPVEWGPFLSAGAIAAFGCAQGDWDAAVLSLGPAARAGYRLVFGDDGIYFEPALGFMALLGALMTPSGNTLSMNAGVTFGLTAGWRF